MNSYETFLALHRGATPLLLGNIWDVYSAQLFEKNGYAAIGTSSQAVAKAWGYDDGEKIAFDLLLKLAQRVTASVKIPFTVDLEAGYSRDVNTIVEHIRKLVDAGVSGINLEDSIDGQLQSPLAFQQTLSTITNRLAQAGLKIFVNVRTDGFLLGLPTALDETLDRVVFYEEAGADGVFVPGITHTEDIAAVVGATKLPVNVMCIPGLPDFATLSSLGVKRMSMGPFLFSRVYREAGKLSAAVPAGGSFASILS